MNHFLWASGHLGWGIFAVAVFTALWFLLTDMLWRLKSTRIARLLITTAAGWMIGVGVVVLVFFMAG